MANPNIVNTVTINGNTVIVSPATTSATAALSNPASSGKIFKINFISAANNTNAAATTTVTINSASVGGGTAYNLAYLIPVPGNSALVVTDKSTSFYLLEDKSIVVTSGLSSAISYVISFEEIS
jgi:hypothetical protein